MDQVVIDYLNPDIPAGLRIDVPLVRASPIAEGFGEIVRDPKHRIEIVPWPLAGWPSSMPAPATRAARPRASSPANGGATSLRGATRRSAATMSSAFANCRRSRGPARAGDGRVLLWHCNYHPDGGQFFWPIDGQPFVVPVALPATISSRRTSSPSGRTAASASISIPTSGTRACFRSTPTGRFFDKQGKVHARVSCDLAREFGMLLDVPLPTALI